MNMATKGLIAGASALLLSITAQPAAAQAVCGPHAQIVKLLNNSLSEKRVSVGLNNNGQVIEVFASEGGGWTMVVTRPNGISCILAAGDAWRNEDTHLVRDPAV